MNRAPIVVSSPPATSSLGRWWLALAMLAACDAGGTPAPSPSPTPAPSTSTPGAEAKTAAPQSAPKAAAPVAEAGKPTPPAAVTPPAAPQVPAIAQPIAPPVPAVAPPVPAVAPPVVAPTPAAPIALPVDLPTLAATAIAAAPTTPPWREVARPSEAIAFEPLTRGVLARSTGGLLDVDASGALVLRPEIEAPKGAVLGVWPDNAWVIERRTKEHRDDTSGELDRQIRLVRLRGGKRWVPQEYRYEQRFDDRGELFAVGARNGMLVLRGCDIGYNDHDVREWNGGKLPDCDGEELARVSDNAEAPAIGKSVGGEIVGFFETRAGEIYTARARDGAVFVQAHCDDDACVTANVRRLPEGRDWSFERPVARQKHSVSVVATQGSSEPKAHLLHYGAGGWQLDALDAVPVGLWPVDDGGVWTLVGDALLHRDPAGSWRAIALPDGASTPSVAMSGDGESLWLAAQVDGATVVFATGARVQAPGPAPETPTDGAAP